MKFCCRLFLLVCALSGWSMEDAPGRGKLIKHTLLHQGNERTYFVYRPDEERHPASLPVLFCLHGGGGNARNMISLTRGRFNELAEEYGFLVVYPQGLGKSWNDGRTGDHTLAASENIDDVSFFASLVSVLQYEYPVDDSRFYATGISNGGFMSMRLACELSHSIRGVAVIAATIGKEFAGRCRAGNGVSLILMNGTADPLVPYEGGQVKVFRQIRGEILSTDETVGLWVARNGCMKDPVVEPLPDIDPFDGTRTTRYTYTSPGSTNNVVLYRVEEGGHTWPGGKQYLGRKMVGPTSWDFSACDHICDSFFRREMNLKW